MYKDRVKLYEQLEELRDSKLVVYVTGDRKGLETQIADEVLDLFVDHLDAIGTVEKISLYLYTRGGQTLTAWSIANLIRQFCGQFEVIVPSKAHSAGTLICLGANAIVMTKQATLGPVDPSVNTPLNPAVPGGPPDAHLSVSVEAINGFIELAKEIGIETSSDRASVLSILASHVHPLVLGQVFRTRGQIQMLARSLLSTHLRGANEEEIRKLVSFLCSESGSHDYTIYRGAARDELGLNVEHPDAAYELIKSVYDDIAAELELAMPYNPNLVLGTNDQAEYQFTRCVLESVRGGTHRFVSRGRLTRRRIQDPQAHIIREGVQDNRTFEGWEHEQL